MEKEIRPAEGDLRKLQLLELDILIRIKEICDVNHITYFLSDGNM